MTDPKAQTHLQIIQRKIEAIGAMQQVVQMSFDEMMAHIRQVEVILAAEEAPKAAPAVPTPNEVAQMEDDSHGPTFRAVKK